MHEHQSRPCHCHRRCHIHCCRAAASWSLLPLLCSHQRYGCRAKFWNIGFVIQYSVMQAIMAEQIDGDTIHHALGINPFGKQQPDAEENQKQGTVANMLLLWRWLITDEI